MRDLTTVMIDEFYASLRVDGATIHPLEERPWNPDWVTKQFIRQRRAAGIEHFRLHDLRHFMATQMPGSGVAVPVVSARLAHARASTTLNVYAHAIPGADVEAAHLISGIIAGRGVEAPKGLLPMRGVEESDQPIGTMVSA